MSGNYHCRTEAGLEATLNLNVVRSVKKENYNLTSDIRVKKLEPEMNPSIVSDTRLEVLRK